MERIRTFEMFGKEYEAPCFDNAIEDNTVAIKGLCRRVVQGEPTATPKMRRAMRFLFGASSVQYRPLSAEERDRAIAHIIERYERVAELLEYSLDAFIDFLDRMEADLLDHMDELSTKYKSYYAKLLDQRAQGEQLGAVEQEAADAHLEEFEETISTAMRGCLLIGRSIERARRVLGELQDRPELMQRALERLRAKSRFWATHKELSAEGQRLRLEAEQLKRAGEELSSYIADVIEPIEDILGTMQKTDHDIFETVRTIRDISDNLESGGVHAGDHGWTDRDDALVEALLFHEFKREQLSMLAPENFEFDELSQEIFEADMLSGTRACSPEVSIRNFKVIIHAIKEKRKGSNAEIHVPDFEVRSKWDASTQALHIRLVDPVRGKKIDLKIEKGHVDQHSIVEALTDTNKFPKRIAKIRADDILAKHRNDLM